MVGGSSASLISFVAAAVVTWSIGCKRAVDRPSASTARDLLVVGRPRRSSVSMLNPAVRREQPGRCEVSTPRNLVFHEDRQHVLFRPVRNVSSEASSSSRLSGLPLVPGLTHERSSHHLAGCLPGRNSFRVGVPPSRVTRTFHEHRGRASSIAALPCPPPASSCPQSRMPVRAVGLRGEA